MADICCGSGAVGLEAVSRGLKHVTFVDKSPDVIAIAQRNATLLNEESCCSFMQADIAQLPNVSAPYDIIFADPPYHLDGIAALGVELQHKGWCYDQTILITEEQKGTTPHNMPNMRLLEERSYGRNLLRFYMPNT